MNLKEIIAVSGHSGLFKLVARGKNNIIVESLLDGKRMPVFAHDKANSLSDIAVFTTGEEIPLSDVFKRIYLHQDKKEVALDLKNNQKEMMQLFEQIIPEYDKERVYASDVKKIFTWYNLLMKNNFIQIEEPQETAQEEQAKETVENKEDADDAKLNTEKKTKPKTQKSVKSTDETTETTEKAKTTRKKKSE